MPDALRSLVLLAAGCLAPSGAADTIYVTGWASDSVNRYDAGTGHAQGSLAGPIDGPLGLCLRERTLYVCSELTNRVLRYDADTRAFLGEFAGPGDGLAAPTGIAFGPDDNGDGHADAFIGNFAADTITVHDGLTGDFIRTLVTTGSGGLNGPDAGLAFGPNGNLYVPSYWSNRVIEFDAASGAFVRTFVTTGVGGLARPRTIRFVESTGTALISCESTDRVIEVDAVTGALESILIVGIDGPSGIEIAGDGTILVTSVEADTVTRHDPETGDLIETLVSPGPGGLQAATFVLRVPDPAPPCAGDLDADGDVGVLDLLALLEAWGPCFACAADLDGSGSVDVADLLTVLAAWGPCGG